VETLLLRLFACENEASRRDDGAGERSSAEFWYPKAWFQRRKRSGDWAFWCSCLVYLSRGRRRRTIGLPLRVIAIGPAFSHDSQVPLPPSVRLAESLEQFEPNPVLLPARVLQFSLHLALAHNSVVLILFARPTCLRCH
jgi:hypothetical protein